MALHSQNLDLSKSQQLNNEVFLIYIFQSLGDDAGIVGSYGVVGSFPKDFDYGPDDHDMENGAVPPDNRPRILLMGLRR